MDLSEAAYARQGCNTGQGGPLLSKQQYDNGAGSCNCDTGRVDNRGTQSCFAPMFASPSVSNNREVETHHGGGTIDRVGQAIAEWSQSHLMNLWKNETTNEPSGGRGTTATPSHVEIQLDGQEAAATVGLVGDGDGDVDVVAKAMNQLSFEEREQAYNDIHGVCSPSEEDQEDPIMIEKSLEGVRLQLRGYIQAEQHQQDSTRHYKQQLGVGFSTSPPTLALRIAMGQDPNYVMDDSFLLMFLRAKEYDATLAAQTILHFLQHKMSLFGRDKLTDDITLDDMNSDDVDTLLNGGFQYVPLQDQTGRHIVAGVSGLEKWKVHENMVRTTKVTHASLVAASSRMFFDLRL